MKFNEKLIELRKKEGLSQEELGYKLNVTRQTVSKWELGQTTPEMEKLLEISKLFNISVDELFNGSEITINTQTSKIEDQPIMNTNDNKKEKNMKIIIIGALVLVVILIVVKIAIALPIFNKVNNTIDDASNQQKNIIERVIEIFDKVLNKIEDGSSQNDASKFNGELSIFNGTQMGMIANKCLDSVITRNNTNEKKITVKYKDVETQDVNEIKNIKTSIDDFTEYEIFYEYDEQGYINKVTIEEVEKAKETETVSKQDVTSFNFKFTYLNGTKKGMAVKSYLDQLITSNKTNDRKITVKYNETETQDPEEIKNLKPNFVDLNDYEVSVDYDENGFINKVTIENL